MQMFGNTEVKISEHGSIPKIWEICFCIYPKNMLNELQRICSGCSDLHKISKHL